MVFLRLFAVILFAVMVSGCATAKPQAGNQLDLKIAELERRLGQKDDQIKDLEFELDQIENSSDKGKEKNNDHESNRVTVQMPKGEEATATISSAEAAASTNGLVRVAVAPKDVQRALKNAGYYQGEIDGKIGKKTRQAIEDFQKENKLKVDGIVGKQTWQELKTHLE